MGRLNGLVEGSTEWTSTRVGPVSPGAPAPQPVDLVLERLDPVGQRPDAPGQPLEIAGAGDVDGVQRGALGSGRSLAGAEGLAEGLAEERVLEQALGEIADHLLAAGANPAPAFGGVAHRRFPLLRLIAAR